ncbi:MAG: glycosyltransferase family 4 protein [Candidatus Omnitrophica bacterium]|nr:glycosyltransferase family 4 protein [Candidatus Omnitrophota bacterium]
MNLAFLSKDYPPQQVGGVGTYVTEMSRLLARKGHQVFVISQGDSVYEELLVPGGQSIRVIRVQPARLSFMDLVRDSHPGLVERLEYSWSVSQALKRLHKDIRLDVVEASEARAEGFWYYLTHRNPPLLIKLHTPEYVAVKLNQTHRLPYWRGAHSLEKHWIFSAHQLVGITQAVVDKVAESYRVRLQGIPLVRNPIDLDFFSPNGVAPSDSQPEILYVGRLEFRKGVQVLARAIPKVLSQCPTATFTFLGDPCGMESYVSETLAPYMERGAVQWLRGIPREELLGYYRRATLVVIPSLWENSPYTCLEAMSCGKPVVCSSGGGLSELAEHGVNGWLTAPGSSAELAQGIIHLLEHPDTRMRLGRNARSHIIKQYDEKSIYEQALAVYENTATR